ncbi:2-hydroxyacid dehydrogenase [Acidipropionibacterium jensenii]|uniref:2-hydroxyacid dehydrogenase n=1 Tax=Acidipropionibacterium jensenii TaxID=1749 RepID=UPI00214CBE7F|nr:2-hydroxyacid dehydrogenase [Acidipropionibacterium jensenii]
MKILCISDGLIPEEYIAEGLSGTPELADAAVIRHWGHKSIDALQADNLKVEQGGPDAIKAPADIFADVDEFDAIITQFCPVPERIIERASALRVIGVLRGGTENVDIAAAEAHGIQVINTPGRNAEAVAEFTLGMILAQLRNISRSDANLRRGIWDRDFPDADAIPEVEGKTVGIVGLGQIGRRVASFVQVMGAKVAFFDPMVPAAEGFDRFNDITELAAASDILCLHARLTSETHHIVSRKVLEAMPEGSILVNTARSGLVDEAALIERLQSGRLSGAAIDTFEIEPLPADSPFLTLRNVTITGHLAGSTIDAFKKTPRLLAPRVLRALREK